MTIYEVCEILNKNEIGFEIDGYVGSERIYINHGAFGHPDGMKIKKNEFRPEFRITFHDGRLYTKVCGHTSYMTMNEILETIEKW